MNNSISVAILWKKAPVKADVEVVEGKLGSLVIAKNQGKVTGSRVRIASKDSVRLTVRVDAAKIGPGANSTLVQVGAGEKSFTFFLRDVNSTNPVFIPLFGVMVVPAT
jgi:hypothetical protein